MAEFEPPQWRYLQQDADNPRAWLAPEDVDPDDVLEVRVQVSDDGQLLKVKHTTKPVASGHEGDSLHWCTIFRLTPPLSMLAVQATGYTEREAWSRVEGELKRQWESEIWRAHRNWLKANDPELLEKLMAGGPHKNKEWNEYRREILQRPLREIPMIEHPRATA